MKQIKGVIILNKRLIAAACAVFCAGLTGTAAAAEHYGFREESALVSPARTPYDGKYTNVQWQTEKAEVIGVPIAYGDSVILPDSDSVRRLNEQNGLELARIKLPETVSVPNSAVIIGDVLIQPTESGLCRIDFTSGEVTAYRTFDGVIGSDVAAVEGLVCFSAGTESGETFYLCDAEDFSVKCSYKSDSDITSAAIQGDYLIFGAGNSLVTCNYKSGDFCEIPLGKEITSAPFATEYAVFFAMGSSTAKLRLNSDGTMEEDTLTLCETGSGSAAPIVYDSYLYTVSDSGFHILDSLNMEITESIPDIKKGSDPIISLGAGTRIYTVGEYKERWALYCVFIAGDEYDVTYSPLAGLDNFTDGKFSFAEQGHM